jgi:GGDEF domain-containing protein
MQPISSLADKIGRVTPMITLPNLVWTRGAKESSMGFRPTDVPARIVSVLLQGIAQHSPNYDGERYTAFTDAVNRVRCDLENAADGTEALLSAGAAVRLLEEYGLAAEQHWLVRQQQSDAVIAMLAATLLDLAGAPPRLAARMKEIQNDLSTCAGTSLAVEARMRLADCLSEIRAWERRETRPAGRWSTDPITGLLDAAAATQAIGDAWGQRENTFAALLTLDRIESINLRFGVQAGDGMFLQLTRRLAGVIGAADRLFRWRGPSFLLLLTREAAEPQVAAEVGRLAATRADAALTIRDRDVIVPLSVSWRLFPMAAAESAEDLLRQLAEPVGGRARGVRRALAVAT